MKTQMSLRLLFVLRLVTEIYFYYLTKSKLVQRYRMKWP
jgi:hypothetical protein